MTATVEQLRAEVATARTRLLPTEERRLEAVSRVASVIPDLDESFARATRLAAQLTGLPLAAFSLVGADRQLVKAAFGIDPGESGEEGVFCRVCVARNDLTVVPDASADPRYRDSAFVAGPVGLRFYAGMPVRSPDGATVGTLCVVDRKPGTLSAEQERVLYDLRAMIEELILLRSLSINDPLTGLYNRRHFDELLFREWQRSQRSGQPMSVLMIDVDHFKSYNDHYGHLAGDQCLRQVAGVLRAEAQRGADLVARYGGEEFVVLLPETDEHGMQAIGERLRGAVAAAAIAHAGTRRGRVTISVGCASVRPSESGPAQVVTRADWALYQAKRRGRDQVSVLRGEGFADPISRSANAA